MFRLRYWFDRKTGIAFNYSFNFTIRFGHSQISVPKIGIPMSKTACINPCENMNKNPQGLLEMIPLQKEVSSFT